MRITFHAASLALQLRVTGRMDTCSVRLSHHNHGLLVDLDRVPNGLQMGAGAAGRVVLSAIDICNSLPQPHRLLSPLEGFSRRALRRTVDLAVGRCEAQVWTTDYPQPRIPSATSSTVSSVPGLPLRSQSQPVLCQQHAFFLPLFFSPFGSMKNSTFRSWAW